VKPTLDRSRARVRQDAPVVRRTGRLGLKPKEVGQDTRPLLVKKVTVLMPADVHRSLKIEAAERTMTIGDIVVEALSSRISFLPRALRKRGAP
jgi:hypothetical protein